jgi:hypothetical protein
MLYVECINCGLVMHNIDSLKETGMLNDKVCPNCRGKLILLDHNPSKHKLKK